MGMLSDENSNRGSAGKSTSSNRSLSAGASKSSTGGGKSSNPSSKTSSSTRSASGTNKDSSSSRSISSSSSNKDSSSSRSSVGGGKASNPATKTASVSTGRSSVGGGKSSNPGSKTTHIAEKGLDSVGKALSDLGSAVTRAFGGSSATVDAAINTVKQVGQGAVKATQGYTKVVGAGPGWTEVENFDGTVTRREGARNWRNNNPGNLEYGSFAKKHGAIGTDGRFAVFRSVEDGIKAQESLVFGSKAYAGKSIKEAIAKYAPSFDNDSGGYAAKVAAAIGVPVTTKLSDLTPEQRQVALAKMHEVEGWKVGKETAMMDASNSIGRVNNNGVYTTTYNGDKSQQVASNDGAFGIDSVLSSPGDLSTAVTSTDSKKKDRLGLGKLIDSAEQKDLGGVVKTFAKAVRDPLGFVIDSIEDGINQNGGFGANLAGTGQGYRDMLEPTRAGQNRKEPEPEPVQTATVVPQAEILPTTVAQPKRQPFGWSQLLVGNQPKFIV